MKQNKILFDGISLGPRKISAMCRSSNQIMSAVQTIDPDAKVRRIFLDFLVEHMM